MIGDVFDLTDSLIFDSWHNQLKDYWCVSTDRGLWFCYGLNCIVL